ncbi:MAG: SAM-dependent methyltransferase [Betaproteobacteria bacterium]
MDEMPDDEVSIGLRRIIGDAVAAGGGWIGFDAFMALALYAPGLGYYARDSLKFGSLPYRRGPGRVVAGSDFVTAPELSPLFGQTLAAQLTQALAQTQTDTVWEFGAGSGALARQLLDSWSAQGKPLPHYRIVELSATLRARQQAALAAYGEQVQWVDALPGRLTGVVLGNELLDAMPVKLLARIGGVWFERGVAAAAGGAGWVWQDKPTALRPPVDIAGEHDYLTEIQPQAEAFICTLAERLVAGAAFFIDYGFPEHEYYHPQRHMGTVMCHRAHQADPDPLVLVGHKDITAHVNFTSIALAAQDAGLAVLGYCSQARFLINCGIGHRLDAAPLAQRVQAQHLLHEHEMGELFKVIGLCRGEPWDALGFAQGDRTHTL